MCRRACQMLGLSLFALLAACATSSSRPRHGASAASAGGDSAPQASGRGDRGDGRREMTWDEYYADVEQRARRAGGFVMWFHPPRPIRRAPDSAAPGNEALTGPAVR